MKARFFFLETAALVAGIALALALLIATVGAVAGSAAEVFEPPQAASQTLTRTVPPAQASLPGEESFEGVVTCSRCGARHSAKIGKSPADCTRICVHSGASFALVNGDTTYLLDGDLNVLKRAAGQRARITGSATGNTIRVSSLTTM